MKARDRTIGTGGVNDSGGGSRCDRSRTDVFVIVKVAAAPVSVSSMIPSRLLSRITLPSITTGPVVGAAALSGAWVAR